MQSLLPLQIYNEGYGKEHRWICQPRHGSLYKSKEILQIHWKVQEGMEIRSINLGFA